jgi:hypothetical protein
MANGFVVILTVGTVDGALLSKLTARMLSDDVDIIDVETARDGESAYKAAGVVLVLGDGAASEFRNLYEARIFMEQGTLLPVAFTSPGELPDLEGLLPIDLSRWTGDDDPELERLMRIVRAVVTNRRPRNAPGWPRGDAPRAVQDLRDLTREAARLGEILINDEPHRRDLVAALNEVGATYRAVNDEISRFAEALRGDPQLQRSRIHQLARGNLMERIHNGRGSCTRIGTLYRRASGLREALIRESVPAPTLDAADAVFTRLTDSDMDLFAAMDSVGETLKVQARAIENLLVMEQDEAARERMRLAWQAVAPLEEELDQARTELQYLQANLGYVEPRYETTGAVKVTIIKQTIHGSVVNSNVVAAETIKNSSVTLASAPVSDELKSALADLHVAVAEMTAHLTDDEASLAADDLARLTEEATRPEPREAWWRRTLDGLVAAGKKSAEVGIPVVDLATKIATLLSTAA